MTDEPLDLTEIAGDVDSLCLDLGHHALLAEVKRLRAAVAEYENALTWDTTCLNCSHLLDQCYAGTVRTEAAEAEVKRLRAQLADGERRGAEKALRDAARSVYNGAPDLEASRGRFHIQSLYNEGASPWLESLADAITNPTPEDTP